VRVWSEKNGRTDILVHGFSPAHNLAAFVAGVVVVIAAIVVIAGMP
jgi:hypothetical protein